MQQRSEETRSRILESAMVCFAKYGFKETSIQQICQDAGVSKGAFYHHFPSKQTLFMELLKGWLDLIELGFETSKQESVPETLMQMTGILPAAIISANDQLPMFLEFWLQASRDQNIWELTIAPYHHFQAYFEELIQRGIDEGSFSAVEPKPVAQLIVSMAVGLLLQGLLDPKGADWNETARENMRIILKGLEV
ncbi:TetR/AcrR family transcriptional regulator [Chloroflexota bacterium]